MKYRIMIIAISSVGETIFRGILGYYHTTDTKSECQLAQNLQISMSKFRKYLRTISQTQILDRGYRTSAQILPQTLALKPLTSSDPNMGVVSVLNSRSWYTWSF